MKEAVLVGMFEELEENRRHGLLRDGDYPTANTLTGGIETDELNLFIETLAGLRGVLTADQRTKLHAATHPTMTFRVSQEFNTKIGLMSLEGIGRVYNDYRDELRLTETQAEAIHSLLEAARRQVLRLGTDIDLSRVEADELAIRLDVDPEAVRAKMQKTGETKGVLFNTLFEVSDSIEAQLTEEQRTKLAELKQTSQRRAAGKEQTVLAGAGARSAPGRAQLRLLPRSNRAAGTHDGADRSLGGCEERDEKNDPDRTGKLKGAELKLLTLLCDQNAGMLASDDKLAAAVRDLEEIRSRITQAKALGYLKARQLLTPEQRQRVHPPPTLEDGR